MNNCRYWDNIKQGDIVEIIAPASALPDINTLDKIKNFVVDLGLTPRIPENIISFKNELIKNKYDPFCANTDEIRLKHLTDAIYSNDSKMIWPIRGGYGSIRLINKLLELPIPQVTKLFLGFSDFTILHLFFQKYWNWPTIHGPVLNKLAIDSDITQKEKLKTLIFGQTELSYDKLIPLNDAAKENNEINSTIIGGNLCLIGNSIGTSWQINAKNKILFLEEVGERGYRIDRSLEHLYQVGIFEDVKAIILGSFTPGYEDNGDDLIEYAIKRFINNTNIPIVSAAFFGHNDKNYPLPLNTKSTLILGKNIRLICATGAR